MKYFIFFLFFLTSTLSNQALAVGEVLLGINAGDLDFRINSLTPEYTIFDDSKYKVEDGIVDNYSIQSVGVSAGVMF